MVLMPEASGPSAEKIDSKSESVLIRLDERYKASDDGDAIAAATPAIARGATTGGGNVSGEVTAAATSSSSSSSSSTIGEFMALYDVTGSVDSRFGSFRLARGVFRAMLRESLSYKVLIAYNTTSNYRRTYVKIERM